MRRMRLGLGVNDFMMNLLRCGMTSWNDIFFQKAGGKWLGCIDYSRCTFLTKVQRCSWDSRTVKLYLRNILDVILIWMTSKHLNILSDLIQGNRALNRLLNMNKSLWGVVTHTWSQVSNKRLLLLLEVHQWDHLMLLAWHIKIWIFEVITLNKYEMQVPNFLLNILFH